MLVLDLILFTLLLSVLVLIFVWLMKKYKKTSFYFVTFFSISVMLIADYESLNLFFKLKVIVVVFPIICFAYLQGFNFKIKEKSFLIGFLEIVILINILMPAIYSLSYSDYAVFLMGLCLIITMPNFELNENGYLGFNDPFWCCIYTFTLILGFLRFDGHTEYIIPGIIILTLGVLQPIFTNNWFEWLNFRVYSLYLIITLDLIARDGNIGFYESILPGLVQHTKLDNAINIIATCLCMIACLVLVHKRVAVQQPINLEN